jgi:hypothetical protein
MKNEEIIKKITRWQACDCVHGLTCGLNDCDHVLLEAIEKDGKVILVCPTEGCSYEQEYIPECVLNADLDKTEKSINDIINKLKGNRHG